MRNQIQYIAIINNKVFRLMRSPNLHRDGLPKEAIVIPVYGCDPQQLPKDYTEPVKHALTWIDEDLPQGGHITGYHEGTEIPVWCAYAHPNLSLVDKAHYWLDGWSDRNGEPQAETDAFYADAEQVAARYDLDAQEFIMTINDIVSDMA